MIEVGFKPSVALKSVVITHYVKSPPQTHTYVLLTFLRVLCSPPKWPICISSYLSAAQG